MNYGSDFILAQHQNKLKIKYRGSVLRSQPQNRNNFIKLGINTYKRMLPARSGSN